MNISKKIMMLFVIIGALSGTGLYARCNACAEKLALKQSIKDALAASLSNKPSNKPSSNKPAHKPSKHEEIDTLEDVQEEDQDQICCAACASGGECDNIKCSCSKPRPPRPSKSPKIRAPRPPEELFQPLIIPSEISESSQLDEIQCLLGVLLKKNAFCCKMIHSIKDKVKDQGHEAERCCRKLKEKIEDLEDLIETQIDQAADCCTLIEELILSQIDGATGCCSLIEELIISQIDQSAECCSLIEELVISQIDQSAECCSLIEELVISQIDQTADCCSIVETRIGELNASAVDFPISEELETFVNSSQFDIITWLKSIYLLLGELFLCNGCLGG